MNELGPDFVQPHGAPGQKIRVLDYLREHPEGLTQLVALQVLAVSRLAAIVFRLKDDDGHNIVTDLVDMETRYGTAKVARYRLVQDGLQPARAAHRTPVVYDQAQAFPLHGSACGLSADHQRQVQVYDEPARVAIDAERVRRLHRELFGE